MEIKFKCCIFSSWGYWYFSLQSWFQLVLHPACHFTWYTLHINYIAGKKNYTAGLKYTPLTYFIPKFEPVCCSISGSNCCFLTCIQISKEAGKMVWYSHLLKTLRLNPSPASFCVTLGISWKFSDLCFPRMESEDSDVFISG